LTSFHGGEVQMAVFWVVMPCSDAVGYKYFDGLWCFRLQGERSSEMLLSYRSTTRRHNPQDVNLRLMIYHVIILAYRTLLEQIMFCVIVVRAFVVH